jgi:hypothetical protein
LAGSSGSTVSSPLRSLQTTARFHLSKSEHRSLAFPVNPPWSWRFHAGPTRDSPDSSARGRNRLHGPHGLRLFVRDTSRFVRPPLFSSPAGKPAWVEGGSSLGVFQRSPLHQHQRHTSAPYFYDPGWLPTHRREVARLRARSALAVPPGFDGLLRVTPCRFIAPCNRS